MGGKKKKKRPKDKKASTKPKVEPATKTEYPDDRHIVKLGPDKE